MSHHLNNLSPSITHLHFDEGVLLRADALTGTPVVVHAGLAVLGREDGVPFAVLHFLTLFQPEIKTRTQQSNFALF